GSVRGALGAGRRQGPGRGAGRPFGGRRARPVGEGPVPGGGAHVPARTAHQRRRRVPLPHRRGGRGVAAARPDRPAGAVPAAARPPLAGRRRRGGRGGGGVRRAAARPHERRPRPRPARTVRPRLQHPDPAAGRAARAAAGRTRSRGGAAVITMAQALNTALREAMEEDERVVVFGEDVGALGGVFRITDGLAAAFGDDRCFDTPLAEAGIAGFAVGMAMGGFRPVIEMQFDAFAYPAFEQIASHVAKMRHRTRGRVGLPIVIRVPYAGGIDGVEHHSDSSEAYYAHTPGLKVVTPATVDDSYSLLRDAIDDPDPVVFMEPKKLYWSKSDSGRLSRTGPFGRAAVRRAGRDVTLVAYGPTVPVALD